MKKYILQIAIFLFLVIGIVNAQIGGVTLWYLDGTTLKPVDSNWSIEVESTGDVDSVGDCTSGACLDGTSDGGTYIRIYDGDSNYAELNVGNIGSDYIVYLPTSTGTLIHTEVDPTVDTAGEILAIIDNMALDFGTGVITATGFVGPLTGAVTGNANTATLAASSTELATNPTDCANNQFAHEINVSGNLACLAIVDADVPDTITVDLATLATTLTITDNESTAENNAVLFTAGGALTGGNLNIESDGTFHYNPSTGLVTATGFAGALTGNASTASALAGDPTDCGANTWATTIATSGDLTCAAVNYAGITAMTSANWAGVISDETGTGKLTFATSPTFTTSIGLGAAGEVRFYDGDSSNYVGLEASSTVASNVTWVLPVADGNADDVLNTDGAGNLSWGAAVGNVFGSYSDETSSRAINTIYQNDSGDTMIALITAEIRWKPSEGSEGLATGIVGADSPPNIDMGEIYAKGPGVSTTIGILRGVITLIIPNNYYYKLANESSGVGATSTLVRWMEIISP